METGSKTLLEWIELHWSKELLPREVIIAKQQWLKQQLELEGNIIPVRLASGWFPKGSEKTLNGITYYAADNEPLAALWGLAQQNQAAPRKSLKELLISKTIKASWPPKKKPSFHGEVSWGPARLGLKDRGYKIAHIINAGRRGHVDDDLKARALRTLSFTNCFPFPNSSKFRFQLSGQLAGDLAESPSIQSILLGYMREYIAKDSLFSELLNGCGEVVKDPTEWRKKASDIVVGVVSKETTVDDESTSMRQRSTPKSTATNETPSEHAFPKGGKYGSLIELVDELRRWRKSHQSVLRLDGSTGKDSNGSPWVHFNIDHLRGDAAIKIERPNLGGVFDWQAYTGQFHFNGDTKTSALDLLIQMFDQGLPIDQILEPDVTRAKYYKDLNRWSGENPCFIIAGTDDAKGFFCYGPK